MSITLSNVEDVHSLNSAVLNMFRKLINSVTRPLLENSGNYRHRYCLHNSSLIVILISNLFVASVRNICELFHIIASNFPDRTKNSFLSPYPHIKQTIDLMNSRDYRRPYGVEMPAKHPN